MGAVVARGTRELVRGAGARARAPVPLSGAARPDALPRSFDRPRPISVLGARFRDARTRVVERAAERHRWCWERGADVHRRMTSFICVTCAVQQASTDAPPERCPICEDERQYVRQGGQAWTTLDELARKGHRTVVRDLESGRGALLVGDTITVVPDVRFVSFMRSYPNHIPLPAELVERIVAAVRPLRFDRIYGGWWDRVVSTDGPAAIERSARRYLRWIGARDEVTAEAGRPN